MIRSKLENLDKHLTSTYVPLTFAVNFVCFYYLPRAQIKNQEIRKSNIA